MSARKPRTSKYPSLLTCGSEDLPCKANRVVVLNAVTHVSLYVALIIYPRYAELDDAVWNAETLDEVCLLKLWVLVVLFLDSTEY